MYIGLIGFFGVYTIKNAIEITDLAADHIIKLLETDKNNTALRIEVKGGGCSGFQYEYSLADILQSGDIEFVHKGAKI